MRAVVALGAFGLADLVVGHRPALERVVTGRVVVGLELAQVRLVDVAVPLVEWK